MAQNKRAGRKSLAQNDFIPPTTPTDVVATNVGTNRAFNDGQASVSFSGTGGTSYTVTASTGQTATGSSSPILVSGLASASNVTFTVTGTNAIGTSSASSPSSSILITTVPATPSAPTASAGVNQDTVSWTAPNNGGSTITQYNWVSSDGKSGNTTGTSVTVSQEGGTAQTYTVSATNANGTGGTSAASNSVTTQSPFFPFFPFFPGFGPYFPYFPFFPGFAPYFPYFPFFPGFSRGNILT
jgi:hypothetical protein